MPILDQYGQTIDTAAIHVTNRLAIERARRDWLTAGYDAAAETKDSAKHWRWADHHSAAAANSSSVRKTLRQRSRYEILESNSFAKGIALTLANDTISTGPSLQCMLPDPAASRAIEQRWRKWCKDVRLADKLRTARLAKLVDGETVILKGNNRRSRNPVQLDVRVIEADMLATPNYMDGFPNQVDGIIFDEWGQPIEYHVLKGHPGDVWPWQAWDYETIDPDDLIHLFRSERPGQQRGIPEMTPALPLFAQLRRYTLAVIAAAENAADFSAVLKTQSNAFDSSTDGIDDIDPFDGVQIDRGMMVSLPRGWDLTQFKPEQPTTTYEGFRNAILNEIARCVHMPSNKALADSSKYNYSSGRLDHQTYYEAISVERSQWEIECLDRIFEWWLDEALMLTGYLPALEPMDEIPHVWRWPPNRDVNPSEVADANIRLIDAGLKTRQQYLIEQNIDPESHAQQLAEEGWVNPNAPAQTATTPSAAPVAAEAPIGPDGEPAAAAEPPPGEFANLSRQQLKRQMAAIDDGLNKVKSGEWTVQRARVFYGSIGLTQQTIDNLLDEFEPDDGQQSTLTTAASPMLDVLADGWVTRKDTDQRLYIEDDQLKTKPGGKVLPKKKQSDDTSTKNTDQSDATKPVPKQSATTRRDATDYRTALSEHDTKQEKFRQTLLKAQSRAQQRLKKARDAWDKSDDVVHEKRVAIQDARQNIAMYEQGLAADPTNEILISRLENAKLSLEIKNVELNQLNAERQRAEKAYLKAVQQNRNAISDAFAAECKAVDLEDGVSAADRRQSLKQIEQVHESGSHIENWANQKNMPESVAMSKEVSATYHRQEAEAFLRNAVNPTIHADALMTPIEYSENHTRAFASGGRYVMTDADGKTRLSDKLPDPYIGASSLTQSHTIIHEYGHHIENGNLEANDLVNSFLANRTSGESPVEFRDQSWGQGYNAGEKGSPDKFDKVVRAVYGEDADDTFVTRRAHYIGKMYEGVENYHSYGEGELARSFSYLQSTEVLSMGLEMMGHNPVAFAQADPEFFNLISGIATGRLLTKTRETRKR